MELGTLLWKLRRKFPSYSMSMFWYKKLGAGTLSQRLGIDDEGPSGQKTLTLTGLDFSNMFRFFLLLGGDAPQLTLLFVDLSHRNFAKRLAVKTLTQIWKKLHKINDVIDSGDVIILRHLAGSCFFIFYSILLKLYRNINHSCCFDWNS